MKNIIFILLFSPLVLLSQTEKKAIELETIKQDNSIQFFCVNNTNITQKVTLTLKKYDGLKGYTNPVTMLVKPKSKILFFSLKYNGDYYYRPSYSYISAMTKQEKNVINNTIDNFNSIGSETCN